MITSSAAPLLTGSEGKEGRGGEDPGSTHNLFNEGNSDSEGDSSGAFAPSIGATLKHKGRK